MEQLYSFELTQNEVNTILFLLETAMDQLEEAPEEDAALIRATFDSFAVQAESIYVDEDTSTITGEVEDQNTLKYGEVTFA